LLLAGGREEQSAAYYLAIFSSYFSRFDYETDKDFINDYTF